MNRLFISHSSIDNSSAFALYHWLRTEGWDDIFLDFRSEREGIPAGERWEDALKAAVDTCEAVLFLVSRHWIASRWCNEELMLANKLNKRLFGLLIDETPLKQVPNILTDSWQLLSLLPSTAGSEDTSPPWIGQMAPAFCPRKLRILKRGLQNAGLDTRFFAWPPVADPDRSPYRGLLPLEADDAGIFFGRDAQIVNAVDELRGLRDGRAPRFLVILGASGAGKSSFLRAGLIPRLSRDDRNFLVLPVIRPERAVLTGKTGLQTSVATALRTHQRSTTASEIGHALETDDLVTIMSSLADAAATSTMDFETERRRPCMVMSIDQGEELFLPDGRTEATSFFKALRTLLLTPVVDVMVILTVRTDRYEPLQSAADISAPLAGIRQVSISLPPIPSSLFVSIIEGPVKRLEGSGRALILDPALSQRLLVDIASNDSKDALPLLAFALERLYLRRKAPNQLVLADYIDGGGIKGSITDAVQQALDIVHQDDGVDAPADDPLKPLRDIFIPWLATIDMQTQQPRRRVALMSEFPMASRPIVNSFIEQRLLTSDVSDHERHTGADAATTVEPAHEALLRQWPQLQVWLEAKKQELSLIESLKRAAQDWANPAPGQPHAAYDAGAWLLHRATRLLEAEELLRDADYRKVGGSLCVEYVQACRAAEDAADATERARLTAEAQQQARTRKFQRSFGWALGMAALILIIGAGGIALTVKGLNQRRSDTLAAMANQSYGAGFTDRAARYAIAGMAGRHWPIIGFDARQADQALNSQREASAALGLLRGHDRDHPLQALFAKDGKIILTASYDGTAVLWDVETSKQLHRLEQAKAAASSTGGRDRPEPRIAATAFSPDGQMVATGSLDGTLALWSVTSGNLIVAVHTPTNANLAPANAGVWSVAFSPDGSQVLAGAQDGRIRRWAIPSGQPVGDAVAITPDRAVRSVAYLHGPMGDGVMAVSDGGDLRLLTMDLQNVISYSVPLGPDKKPLEQGETYATVSPDGAWIAVGYLSGNVRVMEIRTGRVKLLTRDSARCEAYVYETTNPNVIPKGRAEKSGCAHSDFVTNLAFNPDSTQLVTVSKDKTAAIWRLGTSGAQRILAHQGALRSVAFSPNGKQIVTVSEDKVATLWDTATGVQIHTYRGHDDRLFSVAFSADGESFVTGSFDGTARLWDANIADRRNSRILAGSTGPVRDAKFSADGRWVATVSYQDSDQYARVWKTEPGSRVGISTEASLMAVLPIHERGQSIAFSPDGELVATGAIEHPETDAYVWRWRDCLPPDGNGCKPYSGPFPANGLIMSVMFSPDGKRLLLGSRDLLARIYEVDNPSVLLAQHPQGGVAAAAFSPNGETVLSVSYDSAWLWNAKTGHDICPLQLAHVSAFRDATFTMDGNYAITVSEDHYIRIWNAHTCAEVPSAKLERASMWNAAFSPNGEQFVAGDDLTGAITIFDTKSREPVLTLRDHEAGVYTARFSPDGKSVLTGSDDRTARITQLPATLNWPAEKLRDDLCRRVLAKGLTVFSEQEMEAAPVLDPILDRDPCRPPTGWQRLVALFQPLLEKLELGFTAVDWLP